DYIPLVNQLSVHFQIRDDYMNIQSTEYTNTKGYCEDITEGKFSFPVIHSIHSDPNNRQMINILKQRTTDFDLKKHAISLLRDSGSFEYTLDYLHKVEADCRSLIAE
ncbi:isoprenoid synthase domain-containing protein, partial [Piptocephalis cylindrospora]